jgi:hypothetical protein
MGYRKVDGDGLRTRYAGTPSVAVKAVHDGPVSVEISFQAESAPSGVVALFTRLSFADVLEYRWIATDQTYFVTNRDDFEFALIEIVDSGQVDLMVREGMYSDQPAGRRLGGVTDERKIRHFRIGFDDYGTFDIISTGVKIDRYRQVS